MQKKDRRNHKIKSDFGVKDYYKFYKENNGKFSYIKFSTILREFNKKIAKAIVENEYSYKLPQRMGVITIKKVKNYAKIGEDKKVKTNYPVNFKETLELWERNPEAKKEKKLVRYSNKHSNKYTYRFKYLTKFANYKNKTIYKMNFNRQYLKQPLKELILSQGEIERGS